MSIVKDLKYHFCNEHMEASAKNYCKRYHPGYIFNEYPVFPSKVCSYTHCENPAYAEYIGVMIPETIPNLSGHMDKIRKNIFSSSKEALSGGPALERLYLYLKTKVLPVESNMIINKLLKHHAELTLRKLKINNKDYLTDEDINDILVELSLYPADYRRE